MDEREDLDHRRNHKAKGEDQDFYLRKFVCRANNLKRWCMCFFSLWASATLSGSEHEDAQQTTHEKTMAWNRKNALQNDIE